MGRVRTDIKVNGKRYWTLFDPGVENTYVRQEVARLLNPQKLPKVLKSYLGGRVHKIMHRCWLDAIIKRHWVFVDAYVIEEIGFDKKKKQPYDILFGARAMQQWGMELNLKKEKVELPYYPEEFTEF